MKPSVYLETSYLSYATGNSSSDPRTQFRMQVSRTWWERQSERYALYVSETVLDECRRGDPQQAQRRSELLTRTTSLRLTEGVQALSDLLQEQSIVPVNAANDALHIAFAAFYQCVYLLTWNFKHILNARQLPKVNRLLQEQGYVPPLICTPETFLG